MMYHSFFYHLAKEHGIKYWIACGQKILMGFDEL